ncbi:MAG TPA: hypothetical protein DEQ17_02070 [Prevotella sp.]|nr:hypothetical protein [Prevotella sp.]
MIAGTIGKSQWIDRLRKAKKIDVEPIREKWVSFIVATVDKPLPKVKRATLQNTRHRKTALTTCAYTYLMHVLLFKRF